MELLDFTVPRIFWGYLLSFLISGITAGSELIPRYKDDPIKAIYTRWSFLYILLNGLVAVFAFWVILLTENNQPNENEIDMLTMLKYSAFAGLGAMVALRTKLFDYKLEGGGTVPFGPDYVIQIYLKLLDRKIDRSMANNRLDIVQKYMQGISFAKTKFEFGAFLASCMQNLSSDERVKLGKDIGELEKNTDIDDHDKACLLGFLILDLGGKELLQKLVEFLNRKA